VAGPPEIYVSTAAYAERGGVLPADAASHSRLDFIVSNACQTVRRPPEFYT
jgi:hypothetical protein